ncbi:FtsW/RodA/SpoVE family cell cycle protein [Lachnospiraceae bacterium 62-35]
MKESRYDILPHKKSSIPHTELCPKTSASSLSEALDKVQSASGQNPMEEYLNQVTSQMRWKKARSYVAQELSAHIEDQKLAFMDTGMDEEAALMESIRQMGDPVAAGTDMDRVHRPSPDWRLLSFIAAFSILGLIFQYQICITASSGQTAGSSFSLPSQLPGFSLLIHQCAYTIVGIVCMAGIYFADYTIIGKYSRSLWWLSLILLAAAAEITPVINGGHPGLRIYTYLFAPLYAGLLYRFRHGGWKGLFCCFFHALFPFLLCAYAINSIRTSFSLAFIFLVMTIAAVVKGWFSVKRRQAILILTAVPALSIFIWLFVGFHFGLMPPYQKARIMALLNLFHDPESISYLSIAIRQIMSQWRIIGSSMDHISGFLPDYYYNFVVTFLFTAWGILPGLLIFGTYILLFFRIFRTSLCHSGQLGMMTGLSCGLVLASQTFSYIASNLGYSLYSQLSMPFLSYGLSTTIVTYVLMGLLLCIHRYKDRELVLAVTLHTWPNLSQNRFLKP